MKNKNENKQKEALAQIEVKLQLIKNLFKECEELADLTGVSFYWNEHYGMGGSYRPKGSVGWNQSDLLTEGEWVSSSQNC